MGCFTFKGDSKENQQDQNFSPKQQQNVKENTQSSIKYKNQTSLIKPRNYIMDLVEPKGDRQENQQDQNFSPKQQQNVKENIQFSIQQKIEVAFQVSEQNTLVMKTQTKQFIQSNFQPLEQIQNRQELSSNDIVAVYLKRLLKEDQRNEIEKQFNIFRQNINDFRDAKLLGRGDGRIQDIIDPSLHIPKYHYSWVPADFQIQNGQCISVSQIPGVKPENQQIYDITCQLLTQCIPYFQLFSPQFKFQEGSNLQVIVKSQSYQLQPNEVYTGRWHREGLDENIIAVAIYYYQISEIIQQSSNILRVGTIKQYNEEQEQWDCVEFQTDQNDLLVFDNIQHQHMLSEIKNNGSEMAERQIIAFFLVDPLKPIKSAKDFQNVQCTNFEQANERRKQFREKRMNTKSKDIQLNTQKPSLIEVKEKKF